MSREQKLLVDRINELCKEKDVSYYVLSYKSGVPLTTILHILKGTTKNPGMLTVMKLCEGFGISVYEFFDTKSFREYGREHYQ